MKVLKNRAVAVAVLIAAIVLSSLYGLWKRPAAEAPEGGPKLDTSLSTAYYEQFIADGADVLSAKTERSLCVYNANWDALSESILAVVTVPGAGDGIEDAAWRWFDDLEMGGNDALLLFDAGAQAYYVAASGTFYDRFDAQPVSFVDTCLLEYVQEGDYDGAALNLFGQLHPLFDGSGGSASSVIGAVLPVLVLLLFLMVLFTILDHRRYSVWHSRYGGMVTPPVLYRPILWWHRPGSAWYRRRSAPPPPPGPGGPRPPMGSGTPRPPVGGTRPGPRPASGPRPVSGPRRLTGP